MSEMSKAARAAMKKKADKLTTADPSQKVDSSTWSPPEPLQTAAKTGMRPVSRRAYKKGGKVEGESAPVRADRSPRKAGGRSEAVAFANAKINRNQKEANEEREGVKQVGGMNKGGRAEKLSGGALGRYINKAKKQQDSASSTRKPLLNDMDVSNALKDARKNSTRKQMMTMADNKINQDPGYVPAINPHKASGTYFAGEKNLGPAQKDYYVKDVKSQEREFKKGGTAAKKKGRAGKFLGGPMMQPGGMMSANPEMGGVAPDQSNMAMRDPREDMVGKSRFNFIGASGNPRLKHGGKAEKHDDAKQDMALIKKMVKPAARKARKEGGGVFTGPGYPGKVPGVVPGGRTARASGGKAGKGKTNVNIIIATGQHGQGEGAGMMPPGGMPPKPPGGMPIAVPPPPNPAAGAPAPTIMPMPMPMPSAPPQSAGGPPPMGRKAGGRTFRSYKDMKAGAGSGEGRSEKTEISEHKRMMRKDGGHVYPKMKFGAGSGEGRVEKTDKYGLTGPGKAR
jgi:hypothetical protein